MDVKAYVASLGRAYRTVHSEVWAAEVVEAVSHVGNDLSGHFKTLVEIHAAPEWLWSALVAARVDDAIRRMVPEGQRKTKALA